MRTLLIQLPLCVDNSLSGRLGENFARPELSKLSEGREVSLVAMGANYGGS